MHVRLPYGQHDFQPTAKWTSTEHYGGFFNRLRSMFDDLVDLILGKLRTKMTFVTLLAAALFLIRCVAILVFGVVIGTGFFRLDDVRRWRFR